jgi:hypothetical protein
MSPFPLRSHKLDGIDHRLVSGTGSAVEKGVTVSQIRQPEQSYGPFFSRPQGLDQVDRALQFHGYEPLSIVLPNFRKCHHGVQFL